MMFRLKSMATRTEDVGSIRREVACEYNYYHRI